MGLSSVVQQWERTIFRSFQVRSKDRASPWNSSVSQLGSSENQPKRVQHWVGQRKRGVDSGNSLRPTYYFLKGAGKLCLRCWSGRVKRLIPQGRN